MFVYLDYKVTLKTRDFQESVIACLVFNLTFKVNRNERATNNFESWPIKNQFSSNILVEDFDVIFFSHNMPNQYKFAKKTQKIC